MAIDVSVSEPWASRGWLRPSGVARLTTTRCPKSLGDSLATRLDSPLSTSISPKVSLKGAKHGGTSQSVTCPHKVCSLVKIIIPLFLICAFFAERRTFEGILLLHLIAMSMDAVINEILKIEISLIAVKWCQELSNDYLLGRILIHILCYFLELPLLLGNLLWRAFLSSHSTHQVALARETRTPSGFSGGQIGRQRTWLEAVWKNCVKTQKWNSFIDSKRRGVAFDPSSPVQRPSLIASVFFKNCSRPQWVHPIMYVSRGGPCQ